MGEHDYQTPSLHFHYTILLPKELRLWTTGQKERWGYDEVEALRKYLALVLDEMTEPRQEP